MAPKANPQWPVLTAYDQEHLARLALPLGGIGTGTVSLGGRGDLRDWEIVNRPAKGFRPRQTFFALWARPAGGPPVARVLEGVLEAPYEGGFGSTEANHGLPRFRKCAFLAAYPFGQVLLSDPAVPVEVRIEAFNPLVPADSGASGIPAAILRFVLTNRATRAVSAAVCGSLENFIGSDGQAGKASRNVNEFRSAASPSLQGLFLRSEGVAPIAEQCGTVALVALSPRSARSRGSDRSDRSDGSDRPDISFRTAWANLSWGDSLLDFWDDFADDGRLADREAGGVDAPMASLAVRVHVPPRASRAVTFLLTWHFPNRMTWTPAKTPEGQAACCQGAPDPNRIGNHYATRYADAWEVAVRTAAELPELEARTLRFVRAFCASDLPAAVKEAALYNLTALRSQTSFRTEDGRFYGWEGCGDKSGCCHGSCTHVWNYEQATAFLFGGLARSMRETEFLDATNGDGMMAFRVNLPRGRAQEFAKAAADGQMGCLLKLYRDWQLSGDDAWLRRLWPQARKALEFRWIPGGWDADRDGVMEGCQHNTMDVEYYGPNPQMGAYYLGALRACEEMARAVGEAGFAATCRDLFERGSRWMDEHLFNGEYYEHQIRPPASEAAIAPGLRLSMGAASLAEPDLQLGAGCLVDQLVGQFLAHVCGLGYLLDRAHVRKALASILKHNFRPNLYGHFNHLRSFALNDESAVGYYTAGYKFIDAFNIIPSLFTQALFPTLSRMAGERQEEGTTDTPLARAYVLAVKLLLMLALPLAVGVSFTAPALIGVLGGQAFLPQGAIALAITIWHMPFGWINSVTNYALIAVGQQRRLTLAFVGAVAFNLIGNLIFIPRYGYLAAAVITALSEVIQLATFYFYVRRHITTVSWVKILSRPFLAAGLMAMAIFILAGAGQLVLGLLIGAVIYGLTLFVLEALTPIDLKMLAPLLPARMRARV